MDTLISICVSITFLAFYASYEYLLLDHRDLENYRIDMRLRYSGITRHEKRKPLTN